MNKYIFGLLIFLSLSCSARQLPTEPRKELDFCQSNYSVGAQMGLAMASAGDATSVADYASGFNCMSKVDKSSACPLGMKRSSNPDLGDWCVSKTYPLTDLCKSPPIKQTVFRESWVKGICEDKISVSSKDSVYSQIVSHKFSSKTPLGGSFEAGEAIFKGKNPGQEATGVFEQHGITLLATQDSLIPPGVETAAAAKKLLNNKSIRFVTIPATTDYIPVGAKGYYESAMQFAAEFNQKMIFLGKLEK